MAFRNLPPSPSGIIVKEEPCEMATVLIETQMTEEDEKTEESIVSHQDGNPVGKKCNDFLIPASSDFYLLLFSKIAYEQYLPCSLYKFQRVFFARFYCFPLSCGICGKKNHYVGAK